MQWVLGCTLCWAVQQSMLYPRALRQPLLLCSVLPPTRGELVVEICKCHNWGGGGGGGGRASIEMHAGVPAK